jgi:septal ring factor EnvC (AmiA/AmiB activator)
VPDIDTIWGAVLELRTAIIGIDGNNGLRREIREFAAKLEKHIARQEKILADHERKLSNLYSWKTEIDKEREQEDFRKQEWDKQQLELRKARLATLTAIVVALITAIGSITPKIVEVFRSLGGR